MNGAPKQMSDALREIQLVGNMIAGMGRGNNTGIGRDKEDILWQALSFCREVMEEFKCVLAKFDVNMASNDKRRRHWASLKIVFKNQALGELERKLERAKSLLTLAVEITLCMCVRP